MKPAPFHYHRPQTKSEALSMYGTLENSRVLAGGQSLVPMLNMRYVVIDHVIDINRVSELAGMRIGSDAVAIAAMTRQRDVLEHAELASRAPVFAQALRYVGHLQTRNRGTVGGSIAHMDPAAELMGIAALLDATVHAESTRGRRDIAIADYPASYLTPNLEAGEMITAVSFRLPAAGHGWSFVEFSQRHGDFAIVGVGAVLEGTPPDNTIKSARLAAIGVGAAPSRLNEAEKLITGEVPTARAIAAAAEAARRIEIMEDGMVSVAYRRKLLGVLTRRALTEAAARMSGAAGR